MAKSPRALKQPALKFLCYSIGSSFVIASLALLTPYPQRLLESLKKTPKSPTTPPQIIEREVVKYLPADHVDILPPYLLDYTKYPQAEHLRAVRPRSNSLWNVSELARGINFKSGLVLTPGGLASAERTKNENYQLVVELRSKMPTPAQTLAQLGSCNPLLDGMFKQQEQLFGSARVSNFYEVLYNAKKKRIYGELGTLDRLTTRHNFFDCETILELQHPQSKRRALWIQADMDVVSDGSDGDRLPQMPDEVVFSDYYQPFTSYWWKKQGNTPNPMLNGWNKRLQQAEQKLKQNGLNEQQKNQLLGSIDTLKKGIYDLKNKSWLVAEHDPFVVMPLDIINKKSHEFAPRVGDLCVVIFENKLYPAIVGDAGPRHKIGEASLRIARQIKPGSSPYNRPVSKLAVSYVVFPGTAQEQATVPDYNDWHKRAGQLLEELGGLNDGFSLHNWQNTFPPPPPPAAPANPANPANQGSPPAATAPASNNSNPPANQAATQQPPRPAPAATPPTSPPAAPASGRPSQR